MFETPHRHLATIASNGYGKQIKKGSVKSKSKSPR